MSKKYNGITSTYLWECEKGHQWKAIAFCIKGDAWCPECRRGPYKDERLEESCDIAIERGGKCLSEKYINGKTEMIWECSQKHQWSSDFSNTKNGQCCPYCKQYLSEGACREIFESLFEAKFPKKRPKFLGRLELDGYNEDLNLAFEYQGIQHYEYTPFFHRSEENFLTLQMRDRRKYDLCIQNDITLVLVPYKFNYKDLMELEIYIIDQCVSHGIKNEMETTINFIE